MDDQPSTDLPPHVEPFGYPRIGEPIVKGQLIGTVEGSTGALHPCVAFHGRLMDDRDV